MATGRAEDLDSAIKAAVEQLPQEQFSIGDANPRDLEAYAEGDKEQIYDVTVILFGPERRVTVPVEASEDDGIWEVETLRESL